MDQISQFINTPSMPLLLDTNVLGDSMTAMNDMFSTQQFASPIITSPMATNFGPSVFGSSEASMNALDTTSQLLAPHTGGQSSDLDITLPLVAAKDFHQAAQAPGESQLQMQKATTILSVTSSTPVTKPTVESAGPARIGDRELPWSDPVGKFLIFQKRAKLTENERVGRQQCLVPSHMWTRATLKMSMRRVALI
jgi:hypothetical protein